MDLSILPECYVDTNLIETLVPPHKGYNHQMGCGTVAKKMKEYFDNGFAFGIIDKDKKELDYLREFTEIIVSGNLRLHKHRTKNHYMIQIHPAIERFLLENAALADISLLDYNLPSDLDSLKKFQKPPEVKQTTNSSLFLKL